MMSQAVPARKRPEYVPNRIDDPNYVRIFDTTLRDGEQRCGESEYWACLAHCCAAASCGLLLLQLSVAVMVAAWRQEAQRCSSLGASQSRQLRSWERAETAVHLPAGGGTCSAGSVAWPAAAGRDSHAMLLLMAISLPWAAACQHSAWLRRQLWPQRQRAPAG